ncbi:M24 family metallopeptidase [Rhodoplanes sp. Z2-YC6860]|uniref:M24 family metallopeptidase n=1 Tax=Rhodoplanes sp. Z2-YC6860 TaxID=674703 RepID=UPI00078D924C|nr:Xaa-Pro peptidase family protein [Rhodoplanes sp. Z2-YC6860]AMN41176.1 Xaa-Pro dipeptidase [Rhodoplanes sp. Z2-YC6860]
MTELSFPATEFDGRIARIRERMKARGLDALVLTRGENIFYGCGFRASHFASWLSELHALVIPAQGEPRMMTRALEREISKLQWTASPQLYMDHENPYEGLVKILKESGNTGKAIGIEERFLKVSQLRKMQQYLPDAKLSDASGLVEAVAASPSPAESACLRRAARITDIGFKTGIAELRDGVYPYQVIGKIHDAMYQAGQRDFDMSLVCVWSGPQGGRMHDTMTTEKIKNGDIVTVEVWGVDNHYKAGAQASIYVGSNPPANIAAAYDLNAKMHAAAQKAVKAGATAGDVFNGANSVYRPARGTDYYRRCGGSMGLTVFTIDLVNGRKDVLQPGVALLVQTLVDDPVLLTCASTVMVTETGCEELCSPLHSFKTTG